MTTESEKLNFSCDYLEGCHPNILQRLMQTNLIKMNGYGEDPCSKSAQDRIRKACGAPGAEVRFLAGGTQINAVMIDALLASYQGVIAADSGHVAVHEAGAIEAGGHKVLTLPEKDGKLSADAIRAFVEDFAADPNHDHEVWPGMVYLSQPTEFGTLYSLEELTAISKVCHDNRLVLYIDGARLAYALASPENDVTLPDLARLCDAFYIGGTKCGALCGEAAVVPHPELIPHFFTIIKQHGALTAKGRLLGIQFDELFRDDLYLHIGGSAVLYAQELKKALQEKGYPLYLDSPTNQIFFVIDSRQRERLSAHVEFSIFEKLDADHFAARLATSWASSKEDVKRLIALL